MDFIKMVNAEHRFQVLTDEACERSVLSKIRTENRRIQRINTTLIKMSAVFGSVAILALIIK
ncbi:hypothetical protein RASY3_14505 [Ruminococcus albus SY3]|uniref:Uncharacterized protein n=1 Tax=Ruminococcus albus SY3 TaxID=1341156 RepID=A0A011UZD2_RUMAL|nr:hypothetical protein [Ruminococcus albus]EXM38532.1 hypothetical protein RASY3_14505 [Ruminococcus albus SY3]